MTLLWAGFLLGGVFGVAARLGRFCLLRGLRQAMGQPVWPRSACLAREKTEYFIASVSARSIERCNCNHAAKSGVSLIVILIP